MDISYGIKDAVMSLGLSPGVQTRIQCPECSEHRRKSREKTLSLKVESDHALYQCYHCNISGRVHLDSVASRSNGLNGTNIAKREIPETVELDESHLEWFGTRAINQETLSRCGVVASDVYLKTRGKKISCVGFPYKNPDGTIAAIKFRDSMKNFSQVGSANSLWRIEQFTGGDLVVCEGELDSLSYEQVGIFSTSVPNGAPSGTPSRKTGKYDYLWEGRDALANADRILIATDNDGPGHLLAEEIVRRLGRGKCWRVEFPSGCKDASDVLTKFGEDALRETIERATPWPVIGIRDASEFRERAVKLYEGGMDRGVSMGMPALDRIFRVTPQQLTVVTGVPGSGKSTFLTFLSVQLARLGWRSVAISFETPTEIHVLQLASCYLGKPFRGPNKMSKEELDTGLDWVQNNFTFLSESDTSISSVLDRAAISIMRHGARFLTIDPFNFLTLNDSSDNSVSQINQCLTSLKNFAVEHDVSVALVAHPVKIFRGPDGRMPQLDLYSISGSSGFANTSDSGLVVSRGEQLGESYVECVKSRYSWLGSLGGTVLELESETGVFTAPLLGGGNDQEAFDFDDF